MSKDLDQKPQLPNEDAVPTQEEVEKLMAKVDRESAFRQLTGPAKTVITVLGVCFALMQLYNTFTYAMGASVIRPAHLGFVLVLAYLLYPASKKIKHERILWYDVALAVLAAGCCLYSIVNERALTMRAGKYTTLDLIVAGTAILLLLEACRRVVGLPILIIASCFLAYALFGQYMPGFLMHRGVRPQRLVSSMFFSLEGILGTPLGACAKFIFLFILFGAFLERTGVGKFFIDLSNALAGRHVGGPAKVAVLASALEGTVSGSSVANTVGSGSFTIPMMKKLGYSPEFAAAVEAAASTGGQIMPPIMGAAAFLMAEALGVQYIVVVVAAIVPAVLYFAGIWIMVHLEAKRLGLKGLSADQMPRLRELLVKRGYLIVPLVVIIVLLSHGRTPEHSAMFGMLAAIAASFLNKETRMTPRSFIAALESGARSVVGVAIACGAAGIIVGVTTLTGLGLKIAGSLVQMSGGVMIVTLLFTMLSSLILGMGVPTTANYLITSTIMAPAVAQLGVPMLAAHMFVFYFGIVADITPPVALAAYAGSAIAKSNPFKTGVQATKLAIAAFLVPYMFVFNPQLLMIDATPLQVLPMAITALVGMVGVGGAMQGYLLTRANWAQRLILLVGGLMLIDPGLLTDVIGILLIVGAGVWQWLEKRKAIAIAQ